MVTGAVLLALAVMAIASTVLRERIAARSRSARGRAIRALRFRFRRARLPADWWERFEADFAAYVDPRATRARNRERS